MERKFCIIQTGYICRWFCNGCWEAWEEERKEQRLTSGRLFPEDRELWYAVTRPAKFYDLDDDLRFKISIADQFNGDLPWFQVDIPSLCIGSVPEEFSMDFSVPFVTLTEEDISDACCVYFSDKLTCNYFEKLRRVARDIRREKREVLKKEIKDQQEREALKTKQQSELAQKQKDLVQLALKRAAQKKSASPPSVHNPWSSKQATPMLRLSTMIPPDSRAQVPVAMPGWSSAMTAPTFKTVGFPPDPWAVEKEPDSKRPKPSEENPRDRMARLGIPFR